MKNTKRKIEFCHNLNLLFKERGLSISTQARKAQMNKSTLFNWIQGVEPSALRAMVNLSGVLGVELQDLVFENKKEDLRTHLDEISFEVIVRKIPNSIIKKEDL